MRYGPPKAKFCAWTLDQIREHTCDIIAGYVPMKASAASFKGVCPFHDDKHPSFLVKDERFKCFACGAAGDVFTFVMRAENVTFPQAVRIAGRIAGVALKSETSGVVSSQSDRLNCDARIRRALTGWREAALRTTARHLRERDELIRMARVGFESGLVDADLFFHVMGVASNGYSLLEHRFQQLLRDDLFSDLELWREARREAA